MKILKRLFYCFLALVLVVTSIAIYQESTSDSYVVDDIPGGYQVTFSGKPDKSLPRDWNVPYEAFYELKVSSLQNMHVYHMPEELTDDEIDGELDVVNSIGVSPENVERFTSNGNRGVRYSADIRKCLAIVVDRKHVVVLGAAGYGADEFIDSFKRSAAGQ